MIDVVQGHHREVGGRVPAISLFLLSCSSNDLSSYIILSHSVTKSRRRLVCSLANHICTFLSAVPVKSAWCIGKARVWAEHLGSKPPSPAALHLFCSVRRR